ncbi:MaoC family dehydratase [Agitococcus lubricus]|uniref:MaoC dehydratase-like protein n=1 Tax=Agitococcus lubricus TaxID=1077255 RepID=A0A2T5IWR4_9GAMM|nr:MaoC/PaaZ C-terminal domain-containing protein [Agitococcus lubricus]PTQ88391.1 MaoC dehydratase-like protein [Agitococcus lubricus]
MANRTLTRLPSSFAMYPKALVNSLKKKSSNTLPELSLTLNAIAIDRQHLADYNTVCGFAQSDVLPPTYLHMLVMPLQMALMIEDGFPFPLLGLVHIANKITQYRPVNANEKVNVTCRFGELKPHDKGQQFALLGEVYVGNELVWTGESVYLFRQATSSSKTNDDKAKQSEDKKPVTGFNAIWSIPSDIGRRYAAVSGDSNPIHLYDFTAKLFGFPRAIAHGMWTKARCLAAYEGRLPDAFSVDVQFKLPVLLPAKVAFQSEINSKVERHFQVFDAKSAKPHLAGIIKAI